MRGGRGRGAPSFLPRGGGRGGPRGGIFPSSNKGGTGAQGTSSNVTGINPE